MTFLEIWGLGALLVWLYMSVVWAVSLARKDASIVDIFWGLGFVILAVMYNLAVSEGFEPRQTLVTILVTVWGVRLSLHIFARNQGRPEDKRYRRWREQHGDNWWWYSYLQVFLLQGVVMWLVSAPLLAAMHYSDIFDALNGWDILGAMVWTLGFFFEAMGDAHLMRFKRQPENEGKLLQSGVWSYTRHPNYFGDALQWWGFYLIALAAGGWWTIFSPLLMTWLLVRVSGVAMLERDMRSYDRFADYARETPAFLPRIPKR